MVSLVEDMTWDEQANWVDLPPDNNNLLRLRSTTLDNGIPLTSSNILLITLDINGTVFLNDAEFIQRIRSRRILNITTPDVKTSYHHQPPLPLTQHLKSNKKGEEGGAYLHATDK